jgi:AcrR family transcriptional regulator
VVSKIRARSDADKNARRKQLLTAAATLYDQRGLNWTMLEVSAQTGLAKGTTYLYFATKEELLLGLLTDELRDWFAATLTWLNAPSGDPATVIADGIASRPRLVALMSIQSTILEHNLSPRAALEFKSFLLEASNMAAPRIQALLPGVYGMVGLAQLSQPAAAIRPILEQPQFQVLTVDFHSALTRSLGALLNGLKEHV